MKIKEQSNDGVIYQLEISYDKIGTALVDISYSGYTDASENDVLEFVWASAGETPNSELTDEQLDEINDILECGHEEQIVRFLMKHYEENSSIRFDVGEYDWIIKNT